MAQSAQTPRRALITGGASGFGLGVARALLDQGASVAIGDLHAGRLREGGAGACCRQAPPSPRPRRDRAGLRAGGGERLRDGLRRAGYTGQ